ncbi:hypothetical protein [Mechercharimyces sp. CAU 1602]|uniref:hypothetical protein n=1 Tax=Mechercharimyces sp. CAU 1602 TaxID=2973933 RepID=UPI0021623107|nr:hypothetical protein [Mechercharimyces sp. CAU 1602]MCS1350498.1 hypothetical protein [Mechercharimyces sp. CAU 1602]
MNPNFSSYEAYRERYTMFWSEEGDGRPSILSPHEFSSTFQLMKESYSTYQDLIASGKEEEAAHYYGNVIHYLENKLAIADGMDNFLTNQHD